jgi:hypothetical protein
VSKLKFLSLFLIGYVNSVFAEQVRSNDLKAVSQFVISFTQAAKNNDFSKIAKMLVGSNVKNLKSALGNSNLIPTQKKSILSLVGQATSVVIMPVYYDNPDYRKYGEGYTVFFIISDSVSDVLLGKKTWLTDYVACDFFVNKSSINQGPNICYSESEGPFYIKYGDL